MDDCTHPGPSHENASEAVGSTAAEAHLSELRAAVERGLDDIKAGRVGDVEEAFTRIEAMLDELEAAKRA